MLKRMYKDAQLYSGSAGDSDTPQLHHAKFPQNIRAHRQTDHNNPVGVNRELRATPENNKTGSAEAGYEELQQSRIRPR